MPRRSKASPFNAYIKYLQTKGLSDKAVVYDRSPDAKPTLFRVGDDAASEVATVDELMVMSEQAPCGRGEETVIDLKARKTRKVPSSAIRVEWPGLAAAVATAQHKLRKETVLTHRWNAALHDVLIYQRGDFFIEHRDSKKAPTHIATMSVVIDLPSVAGLQAVAAAKTAKEKKSSRLFARTCIGGDVIFPHANEVWSNSLVELNDKNELCDADGGTPWCAWFASELHSVARVEIGYRVVATYVITEDLIQRAEVAPPAAAAAATGKKKQKLPVSASKAMALPQLVLAGIASYLTTQELVAASMASRPWRAYFASPETLLRSLILKSLKDCLAPGKTRLAFMVGMKHQYTGNPEQPAPNTAGLIETMMIDPGLLRGCDAALMQKIVAAFPEAKDVTTKVLPVDVFAETEEVGFGGDDEEDEEKEEGEDDDDDDSEDDDDNDDSDQERKTKKRKRSPYFMHLVVGARQVTKTRFNKVFNAKCNGKPYPLPLAPPRGAAAVAAATTGKKKRAPPVVVAPTTKRGRDDDHPPGVDAPTRRYIEEHPVPIYGEMDDDHPPLLHLGALEELLGYNRRRRDGDDDDDGNEGWTLMLWDSFRRGQHITFGSYWGNEAVFRMDWYRPMGLVVDMDLAALVPPPRAATTAPRPSAKKAAAKKKK